MLLCDNPRLIEMNERRTAKYNILHSIPPQTPKRLTLGTLVQSQAHQLQQVHVDEHYDSALFLYQKQFAMKYW
jgi:hypothetical protein